MLKNIGKHFSLVMHHKWIVFKLSCKAGIPWRGLIHDLSKFSFTEFKEGVKYYQGNRSPISACKKAEGYSKAWLHHRGRNKHHYEYWQDNNAFNSTPIMPYPYLIELICDTLAAGMVYNKKEWRKDTQLKYWKEEKKHRKLNPQMEKFLDKIYEGVAENGISAVIHKKYLKKLYEEYMK